MATVTNTLPGYIDALRRIARETSDAREVIRRVTPLARGLALSRESWVEPRYYTTDADQGFGVHLLHEEPDHTLAVMAIAWLPGRGAPPHNHGTWAIVAGVDGPETNVFWTRLDDGSRKGFAEIEKQASKVFAEGEVVSFLPESIHSVINETDRVTLSLHTYGKNLNYTGRSQFNPIDKTETPFIVKYEA